MNDKDASLLAQLVMLQVRAEAGDLTGDESAAMYELIGEVREQADYYERALIRSLRWQPGPERAIRYKWREIAERVGVESRQGAHQRWARLIG